MEFNPGSAPRAVPADGLRLLEIGMHDESELDSEESRYEQSFNRYRSRLRREMNNEPTEAALPSPRQAPVTAEAKHVLSRAG